MSNIHTHSLFFALSNNAMEVYNIPTYTKSKENTPEAARLYSLDLPGHRTDVRTLALSSDDALLASASNGKTFDSTVLSLVNAPSGS
jgi:U3 small nucleolar RNA-associated protein 12